MRTKPTSMASFDGNLLATKSMKIPNEDAAHSTVVCYDMVVPNTKYYYCFRAVDIHDNISNPTDLFEVEMFKEDEVIFLNFQRNVKLQLLQLWEVDTPKKYTIL